MNVKLKTSLMLSAAFAVLLLASIACGTSTPAPIIPTPPATLPQPTLGLTQPPTSTRLPPTPTNTLPATDTATLPPTLAVQPAAPSQLTPGDQLQLDEIHMLSLTSGWGILGRLLLVTTDAAQTWHEVTPVTGQADLLYGAFLDPQTAWIISSDGGQVDPNLTVYITHDGGQTWSTSPGTPLGTTVSGENTWPEFAFLDANNLWVMIRGIYLGAGTHYSHALFHTGDGGLTWASLDGEISDDYTGMVFADAQTGLRTLQTTGPYGPGAPSYDITSDGGATWTGQELPPPSDASDLFNQYPYCETYQPGYLSKSSIHMLVGCFDDQTPPAKSASYLYTSSDSGATWTTVHLPDKVQASQDTLLYFDATHALLLGRDIYQSSDGGQTWSFVQTVNWDGQFSFVDPLHGWAVVRANGQVALVQTSNGGKYWSELKPTVK